MNLRDDLHTHFETTPASYEASVTGSVYGITSWIYDWCDEPPLRPTSPVWDYYTTFGNEQGGFVQRTLVNWAVTNGFRFR